jgi:hypothetical protein
VACTAARVASSCGAAGTQASGGTRASGADKSGAGRESPWSQTSLRAHGRARREVCPADASARLAATAYVDAQQGTSQHSCAPQRQHQHWQRVLAPLG